MTITTIEEFSATLVDDVELATVWTTTSPVSAQHTIAILLHGGPEGNKNGPDNLLRQLAERLACAGIDVVRFDFMGQGDSSGKYINTTLSSQRHDFRAIFQEVQRRGYKRIGVVAESFGATCALGEYDDQFAVMALLWPAIYLLDVCFAPFFEEPYKSQLAECGHIKVGEDEIGAQFLDELKLVDNLEEKVRLVRSPTLLIHGDNDSEVPHHQSEKAYAILPEPKRLVIVPGADHCLRRPMEQALVFDEVVAWFQRYL